MILTFYILIKGRRPIRFDSAAMLDLYVKENKLPPLTMILLKEDNKEAGKISVENYKKYMKHGEEK